MPPSQTGFGGFLLPIFISEKSIRKRNSMLLLSQNIKIERCILILGINIEPGDLADLRKSINRLDVYCAASSGQIFRLVSIRAPITRLPLSLTRYLLECGIFRINPWPLSFENSWLIFPRLFADSAPFLQRLCRISRLVNPRIRQRPSQIISKRWMISGDHTLYPL